ncbi:MAG: transposase, partial [Mycobacterium sp.]
MSLMGFLGQYGTEDRCREALAKARWPQGFVCSECG